MKGAEFRSVRLEFQWAGADALKRINRIDDIQHGEILRIRDELEPAPETPLPANHPSP